LGRFAAEGFGNTVCGYRPDDLLPQKRLLE
jgi:hypothetical protein